MEKLRGILALVCIMSFAATACGTAGSTATPDTQATVDAAVAATMTADAALQATVGAVVQATVAAASTPTPAAEYVTMTEEELETLIDESVAEAAAATEMSSDAAAEVAADDVVTQEDVDEIEVYLSDVEEAIALAEDLIEIYDDLYGELAIETIELLYAIEQDLALLAESAVAMTEVLLEMEETLEQGLALVEDTITQLENAAQLAGEQAAVIEAQAQAWTQNAQAAREGRAATMLSVQPNSIPGDRRSALQSAFDYVDAVRGAWSDERISQAELANIAQLGANAIAGLDAHGGPQLQQLSGSINQITAQLAQGQALQAQASLGVLEGALGSRPSRPF